MNTPTLPSRRTAFTFVEMLVAMSLTAIFLGAASLVYSAITANSKRLTTSVDLDIGAGNQSNFYNRNTAILRAYSAPNYGRAAFVQQFREEILEDAADASVIHILPRNLRNTIRPEFLRYTAGDPGSTETRPRLDTPEAFRQFLAAVEPTSAGIYDTAIRNIPPTDRTNLSIFFLGPETDPGYIRVNALYEIDWVTPTNNTGSYVTVRRYRNGTLTNYYDIFFEADSATAPHPFQPGFAAFERLGRRAVDEGTAIDRFKVAPGSPFYLLWLPDPAVNPYEVPAPATASPASSPRNAYDGMTGKTSFLVVLPMFPNY